MKNLKGDILDARHGIICHQVNCQLIMGAGLAKQIRTKYPVVFGEYKKMKKLPPKRRLGQCQIVEVIPRELFVANLFGQFDFRPRGVVHTDYTALTKAMNELSMWHKEKCHPKFPIWIPYKIGCGLAGGDWNTVLDIISLQLANAYIVRKGK
jgi:O-acetyl-ADP-ribose deacetylase (regulator of RNase III)